MCFKINASLTASRMFSSLQNMSCLFCACEAGEATVLIALMALVMSDCRRDISGCDDGESRYVVPVSSLERSEML